MTAFDRFTLLRRREGLADPFESWVAADPRRFDPVEVLRLAPGASADVRRRFREPPVTLMHLSHPAIAAILEVGSAGDEPFWVVARTPERTLGDLLEARRWAGPLSWAEIDRIAADVLAALDRAHPLVEHGAISPENICLFPDGHARVRGFGLAAIAGREPTDDLRAFGAMLLRMIRARPIDASATAAFLVEPPFPVARGPGDPSRIASAAADLHRALLAAAEAERALAAALAPSRARAMLAAALGEEPAEDVPLPGPADPPLRPEHFTRAAWRRRAEALRDAPGDLAKLWDLASWPAAPTGSASRSGRGSPSSSGATRRPATRPCPPATS